MDRSLSDAQIEYYSRQILLRELGGVGQKRFLDGVCLLAGGGDAAAGTCIGVLLAPNASRIAVASFSASPCPPTCM